SRRRHTRCYRDWSSDVCSSDLTTERASLMRAAVDRMNADPAVVQLLGKPIKAESRVEGEVRHDETGWREARLMIPIRGPKGKAVARVIAGSGKGRWNFHTFEVVCEQRHMKLYRSY